MNFIESFNSKTILIPLLQRDYVQGGREDVIVPFLDSLLKTNQDLNYIYGYEEDGCFVPVRRTTASYYTLASLPISVFKKTM